MTNHRKLSIALILGVSLSSYAALPPAAIALRDLAQLQRFVEQHPFVAATLESINVKTLSVYYNGGCEARFKRKKASIFSVNKPGPQPGLQFKASSCSLDK